MYELVIALLVKMQNELASHLKRQRCENGKENTKCWTIYQGVNFNFNYPRTNKTVKILDMSLRLKKVCPVFKTYPITELKMQWLIHWHLCLYRGVKVWSLQVADLGGGGGCFGCFSTPSRVHGKKNLTYLFFFSMYSRYLFACSVSLVLK